MPTPNPDALHFLQTRRSRPAKTLTTPVPDRDTLTELLTVASRAPDHGMLEPWRFIVIEKPAMARLADIAEARGTALALDPEQIQKGRGQFDQGDLAVVVVEVQALELGKAHHHLLGQLVDLVEAQPQLSQLRRRWFGRSTVRS